MKSGFYFVLKGMGNTDNFKCWKVDRTESWNCEIESRENKQLTATQEKYKRIGKGITHGKHGRENREYLIDVKEIQCASWWHIGLPKWR